MTQDISDDRVEIKFDAHGPMELSRLADSFSSLTRQYSKSISEQLGKDIQDKPKLYVSRLETGSIIAEVALGAVILGHTITAMDYSIIVADFTARVSRMLRAFAGMETTQSATRIVPPTLDDARDLRDFLKPVAGRPGANLQIKRAKYHRKSGDREVLVEYEFGEAEVNRAAIAAEKMIMDSQSLIPKSKVVREVLFVWHQTNREDGKPTGRTGDRAVISDVTDKPLPVYFPKGIGDVKRRMTHSDKNPFSIGYVVDVSVQYMGDEPKLYRVMALHDTVPLD